MRFLLEASNKATANPIKSSKEVTQEIQNNQNERDQYFLMTKSEREDFIKNKLNNNNINKTNFAYAIAEDDRVYYQDHPLYIISQAIPKKIGSTTEYTILELGSPNNQYSNVLSKANWLGSTDLYNDEDANVAYKIKALTLAASQGKDLNQFKNDGHWLPINKFKEIATNNLDRHISQTQNKKREQSANNQRISNLAKATNKSEQEIQPIVKEVDTKLEAAIKDAVNQILSIQSLKLNRSDVERYVRNNLQYNPDTSLDTLLTYYLKGIDLKDANLDNIER